MHVINAKAETQAKNPRIEKLDRLGSPVIAAYTPAFNMLLQRWSGGDSPNLGVLQRPSPICGAVGMFCVFLAYEYCPGETTILSLSLFRNKVVCCAAIISAMSQGGFSAIVYYLPT